MRLLCEQPHSFKQQLLSHGIRNGDTARVRLATGVLQVNPGIPCLCFCSSYMVLLELEKQGWWWQRRRKIADQVIVLNENAIGPIIGDLEGMVYLEATVSFKDGVMLLHIDPESLAFFPVESLPLHEMPPLPNAEQAQDAVPFFEDEVEQCLRSRDGRPFAETIIRTVVPRLYSREHEDMCVA
jgi:hypothetical protein